MNAACESVVRSRRFPLARRLSPLARPLSVRAVLVLPIGALAVCTSGCSVLIAQSTDDPSTVLDRPEVRRSEVESRLGNPVRTSGEGTSSAVCDYEYTFKPGASTADATGLASLQTNSDQFLLGVTLRLLAEPVLIGAALVDKQVDRQPGRATVAYASDGRMLWWQGTRSNFQTRYSTPPGSVSAPETCSKCGDALGGSKPRRRRTGRIAL